MRGFTLPSDIRGLTPVGVLSKTAVGRSKTLKGGLRNHNPNPALPVGVIGLRPGLRAEPKPATGVGDGPVNLPAGGERLTRWNPQLRRRGGQYRKIKDKFICVVCKHLNGDGFIITTYITDRVKEVRGYGEEVNFNPQQRYGDARYLV